MKFITLLALSLSFNVFAASKVELRDCADANVRLEDINFGADNQKSFYNGTVGVVSYYHGEPAAAPTGIAIVYNKPIATESGYIDRGCVAIAYLTEVNMKGAKAAYDPKTGVTLNIPVVKVGLDDNEKKTIQLSIKTINTGKPNEGQVISAKEL